MGDLPSVTIAIPTFNEEANIDHVLQIFLNTKYSGQVTIVVADGNSEDNTRKIVSEITKYDSRVKLIENPQRIQSAALNIILRQFDSDVFLRADAHSDYASDYIERCIEALLESNATDAGGAQRFVAETPFQAGIALATKTFFGSGGAKYRDPDYSGYADTVFLGCFWRKKLLEIGGFRVARNEDAELNLRLVHENPEAVYVSSKIKVWYYPRKTWKRLWLQYVKRARGRCLTHARHPDKFHLRSRIPLLFIPGLLALFWITKLIYELQMGLIPYILCWSIILYPVFEALRVTLTTRQDFKQEVWRGHPEHIPSMAVRFILCLIAMLTMPLAYNYGYLYHLFQMKIIGQEKAVFFE